MAEATIASAAPRRRSSLDGMSLPAEPAFRVTALGPIARFSLRGDARELSPTLASVFNLALPDRLNTAVTEQGGRRAAFSLGPDEWLLLAPGVEAGTIGTALARSLSRQAHSLTDVSHRQLGLLLDGRAVTRVLAAGCPLDLRPAAFPVGKATRTIFAKAEIILWRQADERFHVEVWRSFAPYLIGHLTEACAGVDA